MKRILLIAGATALLALSAASTVNAGPASGSTELLGTPAEDTPLGVKVSINTNKPLVPGEYSIVNICWFPNSNGHYDSYERQDLNGPWFDDDGPAGAAAPYTTATINLQLVPEDATCKVSVVRGSTLVKGTTTAYTVGP